MKAMTGPTNIPKYHHFVPQMVLRRFTDAKGKFWIYIKVANKVVPGSPETQFGETHFHTVEDADGQKDTSAEQRLSVLEGKANLIIEKIVAAARAGKTPGLTAEEKATWDTFFHLQWKRVPDMLDKAATFQNPDTAVDAVLVKARALYPDQEEKIAALDNPEARARLLQGGKVRAIEQSGGKVPAVLAGRGLAIARITAPGESFAIGSLPMVRLKGDLTDPDSEVWMPVASDVAVGVGLASGEETLIDLSDLKPIWDFNAVTAAQSSKFAAASKALVEQLKAYVETLPPPAGPQSSAK
ncbi:DUF4238 domain-containing protein [Caulobacter sp. S45]|uniref:DUF4238 domain-containing protein n=1 Tax=Caulobacter sp. S45 TaxID=1641861 RepID=UPI00131AB8ED|nr:DUF4238 domain-containing protein [Caulobacter sp. S45]